MYLSVFELVLILIVEDHTVFINETHHGGLPPRTPDEVYYQIEEPIL